MSLAGKIRGSRNRGGETRVAPFTVTPSDVSRKLILPIPRNWGSVDLENLVPKENISTRRHCRSPTNC